MNPVIRNTLLRAGVLLGLAVQPAATVPAAAQADGPSAGSDPVPRLVREALARPDDPAAWTGLAEALPELALTRDADPVTVFEASRLADSLATVPVEPVADATRPRSASAAPAGWMTFLGGLGTWAGTRIVGATDALSTGSFTTSDAAALAPWCLVVVLLVAGPILSRIRTRKAPDGEGADGPAADSDQGPVPGVSPRLWTVTTLADNGLPPAEIARRTGMAQDAVQVLLGLRDAPVPAASKDATRGGSDYPSYLHGATTGAGRTVRPPSVTERAAGIATLRDELSRDASRLKGGRLTYGGGRAP